MSYCGYRPANPACGSWVCADSGWDLVPYPAGRACQGPGGYPGTCDGIGGACPVTSYTGQVIPDFMVTHVIYALPGKQSSVAYSASNTYGSTTTCTNSFKISNQNVISFGLGVKEVFSSSYDISIGADWNNTDTTATDISISYGATYTVPANSDFIDHDEDIIWILIDPTLTVTITPAYLTLPQLTKWGFSAQPVSTSLEYPLKVKWLRNPANMPSDVKARLTMAGITSDYYQQILNADPFANGAPPNPALDPARFIPVTITTDPLTGGNLYGGNAIGYVPVTSPGYLPATLRYVMTRIVTNTSTTEAQYSNSVGYTINDSFFFGLFSAGLKQSTTFSWTHSSNKKTSTSTNTSDTITVGQPAYDYNGPTVLRVYEDTIWKTYFFSLDWI